MSSGTNEWQRVDNTGCFYKILTGFLLCWAVIIPYSLVFRNVGWLVWAVLCVGAGGAMLLREKRRRRSYPIPDVAIELVPSEVELGGTVVVRLLLSGDVARTIRWWRASFHAAADDEPGHDSDEQISDAELAVDPAASDMPISELEMVLSVPTLKQIQDVYAKPEGCFVRVTIETEHGRMESGKVAVRVGPR